MVMRKISKQFDRAVLESTRLAMAECRERKTKALKRQKEIQGTMQESYFRRVKQERQKLVDDLLAWKDHSAGYNSLIEEIRGMIKKYNAVQGADVIDAVTHGRAKVRVDATIFAMKFTETFKLKKHAWAILSDYANLFAHMYK